MRWGAKFISVLLLERICTDCGDRAKFKRTLSGSVFHFRVGQALMQMKESLLFEYFLIENRLLILHSLSSRLANSWTIFNMLI